jgi:hypothetical protein
MRGNNRSNWTRIICASLAPSTNLGQNMIDFRSIGHIMLDFLMANCELTIANKWLTLAKLCL